MKTLWNAMFIGLLGALPVAAFAAPNILNEASSIEAKMEQVKPEPMNADTIDEQQKIVSRTIQLVKRALAPDHVEPATLKAVTRVMAKDWVYDQPGDLVQMNYQLLKKHWKAIDQELDRLEKSGDLTPATVRAFRGTVDIAIDVRKRGGTDKTNPTEIKKK